MSNKKNLIVIVCSFLVIAAAALTLSHDVTQMRKRLAAAPAPPAKSATGDPQAQSQIAALRASVAANPSDRNARWGLVALYGPTGQTVAASEQLDAIEKLGIQNEAERLSIANSRLLLGEYSQSEEMYRKAISSEPGNTQALQGLSSALYRQQRFFEAMLAAHKAVLLDPNQPANHFLLGSSALAYSLQFASFSTHNDTLALARSEFLGLTKTMAQNPDVFYDLGQCEGALSQTQQAIAALKHSIALQPRPGAYEVLTVQQINTSDLAAARSTVEQGLAQFPEDPALHDLHGRVLQSSMDPALAAQSLAEFQQAASLAPDHEIFQQHLGASLLRAGKLPEAKAAFEAAIKLDPNATAPYQQLATVETRLGDTAAAKVANRNATAMAFNAQQLKQIQALTYVHPDAVPLRLILADRYRQLGMLAASRDEYLLVTQLDPHNARAVAGLKALASEQH